MKRGGEAGGGSESGLFSRIYLKRRSGRGPRFGHTGRAIKGKQVKVLDFVHGAYFFCCLKPPSWSVNFRANHRGSARTDE